MALAELRRHCRPGPDGTSYARLLRLGADLSLAEIGARLGVNGMTVSRYELGVTRPRGEVAARYIELLNELRECAAKAGATR